MKENRLSHQHPIWKRTHNQAPNNHPFLLLILWGRLFCFLSLGTCFLLEGFNSAPPAIKKGGVQHWLYKPPGALLTADPHARSYHLRVKGSSSMRIHKNPHDALQGMGKSIRETDSNENRLFICSVPLFTGPLHEKCHPYWLVKSTDIFANLPVLCGAMLVRLIMIKLSKNFRERHKVFTNHIDAGGSQRQAEVEESLFLPDPYESAALSAFVSTRFHSMLHLLGFTAPWLSTIWALLFHSK